MGFEAAADVGLAVAQHPALRGVEAVVRDRFEQVGGRGFPVARGLVGSFRGDADAGENRAGQPEEFPEFHEAIVDAKASERRQQMLDCAHLHIPLDQGRAKHGFADQMGLRRDIHRRGEIHAAKHDAGIGWRRTQGHKDLLAGVQPHASGANGVL